VVVCGIKRENDMPLQAEFKICRSRSVVLISKWLAWRGSLSRRLRALAWGAFENLAT
jgi:hypothetical protein